MSARLDQIHENIVALVEAKVNSMLKDIEELTDNQMKVLEIANKMLSVCMARTTGVAKGKFADSSDEELESSF